MWMFYRVSWEKEPAFSACSYPPLAPEVPRSCESILTSVAAESFKVASSMEDFWSVAYIMINKRDTLEHDWI